MKEKKSKIWFWVTFVLLVAVIVSLYFVNPQNKDIGNPLIPLTIAAAAIGGWLISLLPRFKGNKYAYRIAYCSLLTIIAGSLYFLL